jgi:hypothetical protein
MLAVVDGVHRNHPIESPTLNGGAVNGVNVRLTMLGCRGVPICRDDPGVATATLNDDVNVVREPPRLADLALCGLKIQTRDGSSDGGAVNGV